MEIICDDREFKVFTHAAGMANVSRQRLTTGDFLIGYRAPSPVGFRALAIVERKTWADLAASIKDGRAANIEKLREFKAETGARIVYLLEGTPPKNPAMDIGGIPYKSLRAHVDHLLYTDGIIELHSSGPRASLERLIEFAGHLKRFATEAAVSEINHLESATKKRPAATEEQISDTIWSAVRGISATSACAFRPYKIAQLFSGELDMEILSNILINGRRFGSARARQLLDYIETESFLKQVLNAVPSMGPRRVLALMSVVGPQPRRMFQEWTAIRATKCISESCFATIERFLMQPQEQELATPDLPTYQKLLVPPPQKRARRGSVGSRIAAAEIECPLANNAHLLPSESRLESSTEESDTP